jgi:hypothetical protein
MQNAGRESCHSPVCVDSSSLFPRACRPGHACYLSLSSLASLLPISTPRAVARSGGWGCSGGGGHPHPRLPHCCGHRIVGVLGHARRSVVVLPHSCYRRWLCPFPLLALLPVLTPRAAARSGGWPSSSCPSTRDPPCEQWRAAAVGSLFLPLVLVVLPISTPRAVARGGDWGCRRGRGVSSSLLFVVPLSTLRAGARSCGVGVGGAGSCFVS